MEDFKKIKDLLRTKVGNRKLKDSASAATSESNSVPADGDSNALKSDHDVKETGCDSVTQEVKSNSSLNSSFSISDCDETGKPTEHKNTSSVIDDGSHSSFSNKNVVSQSTTAQDRKAILESLRERKLAQMYEMGASATRKTIKINLKSKSDSAVHTNMSTSKLEGNTRLITHIPSENENNIMTTTDGAKNSGDEGTSLRNGFTPKKPTTDHFFDKANSPVTKETKEKLNDTLNSILNKTSKRSEIGKLFDEIKSDKRELNTASSGSSKCLETNIQVPNIANDQPVCVEPTTSTSRKRKRSANYRKRTSSGDVLSSLDYDMISSGEEDQFQESHANKKTETKLDNILSSEVEEGEVSEEGELPDTDISDAPSDAANETKKLSSNSVRVLVAGDNRCQSLMAKSSHLFPDVTWCIINTPSMNYSIISDKLRNSKPFDVVLMFCFHLDLLCSEMSCFEGQPLELMKLKREVSAVNLIRYVSSFRKMWRDRYPSTKFIWATPYPIDFLAHNVTQLRGLSIEVKTEIMDVERKENATFYFWNYIKEINKAWNRNTYNDFLFPLHYVMFSSQHSRDQFGNGSGTLPDGYLSIGVQPTEKFQVMFSDLLRQFLSEKLPSLGIRAVTRGDSFSTVANAVNLWQTEEPYSAFNRCGDVKELSGQHHEMLVKHRELFNLYHETPTKHPHYQQQLENFTRSFASRMIYDSRGSWTQRTDYSWRQYWLQYLHKDFDVIWKLKKNKLDDPESNDSSSSYFPNISLNETSGVLPSNTDSFTQKQCKDDKSDQDIVISSDSEGEPAKRAYTRSRSRTSDRSKTSDRSRSSKKSRRKDRLRTRHKSSKKHSKESHKHSSRSRKSKRKRKKRYYSPSPPTSSSSSPTHHDLSDNENEDIDDLIAKARKKVTMIQESMQTSSNITEATKEAVPIHVTEATKEAVPIHILDAKPAPLSVKPTVEHKAVLDSVTESDSKSNPNRDTVPKTIIQFGVTGNAAMPQTSDDPCLEVAEQSIIDLEPSDNSPSPAAFEYTGVHGGGEEIHQSIQPHSSEETGMKNNDDDDDRSINKSDVADHSDSSENKPAEFVALEQQEYDESFIDDINLEDQLDNLFDDPDFMKDIDALGDQVLSIVENNCNTGDEDDLESSSLSPRGNNDNRTTDYAIVNKTVDDVVDKSTIDNTVDSSKVDNTVNSITIDDRGESKTTNNTIDSKMSANTPRQENYMIELLRILTNISEHFGPLSVSIVSMHEKALEYLENGEDPLKVLNKSNSAIFEMIYSELNRFIADTNTSSEMRALYSLASKEIRKILDEPQQPCDMFHGVNIANIAHATIGAEPARIIAFIKNTLVYHGLTSVPSQQITRIFMAVKSVQLRILKDEGKLSLT